MATVQMFAVPNTLYRYRSLVNLEREIAYNFRELLGELPDDVHFTRLYYTERIPVVGISRQEPENLAKRVLSYKNHRWAYEREWRMFAPKGVVPYKTRKSIRHVYLGYRAADEGAEGGRRPAGQAQHPAEAHVARGLRHSLLRPERPRAQEMPLDSVGRPN